MKQHIVSSIGKYNIHIYIYSNSTPLILMK